MRKQRSHSIRVARTFLDAFRAARPDARIDLLDLWAEELPRFDGATIDAKYAILAGEAHDRAERRAWAAVEAAVALFTAAPRMLFSVPMWNFNVPYVLKHYIDVVTQPTLTFSFEPASGYRGLVTGKRAVVIYASSGRLHARQRQPAARFPEAVPRGVAALRRHRRCRDDRRAADHRAAGSPRCIRSPGAGVRGRARASLLIAPEPP